MESQELLRKVRKIEIKSRGLSNQIFSGEYHSAFKGRGMAFSEVREYQMGDEIRTIDWNVTARFNHPYVKVFEEERELTVMLLVDVSQSENFGTNRQLKQNLITEICAVLAFSAIQNNDKVGVIFFSDKIEKFISPKKGRSHILTIIRELVDFTPENTGTDIGEALGYFTGVIKKRCTAFLISDFLSPNYETALRIANKKHDVVALKVSDRREHEIPSLGIIQFVDRESGKSKWVDTSSQSFQHTYKTQQLKFHKETDQLFRRCGVDVVHLYTGESYVRPLMNLFKMRESRR